MLQNNSKLNDDNFEIQRRHNKFFLQTLFNYIFKVKMVYTGQQNKVFYFCDTGNNQYHTFLMIMQKFALNSQAKILKKLKISLKCIAFQNQSNYFIAQTDFHAEIWKIDKLYNLNFVRTILTYEYELKGVRFSTYNSFLLLHEDEKLIITTEYESLQLLIKGQNEDWQLLQQIQIGSSYQMASFDSIQLNDQGTIIILSVYKSQLKFSKGSQHLLLVILKNDEQWAIIQEINLKYSSNYQFCFLDDDKFLIFENTDDQNKLQIWQVFWEDFEVKQLQKQKLKLLKQLSGLSFIKQHSLLFAWNNEFIYMMKQNNNEFYVSSQITVPKGLCPRNLINNELLIFDPSKYPINKVHKMQLSNIIFGD